MFFRSKTKPILQFEEQIKLEKWHALGNDFLIANTNFSTSEIKKLSDRNFGIGCDQFVILEGNTVKFFNADGTESGMCGNALKCIGEILAKERASTEKPSNEMFSLNTSKGEVKLKIEGEMTSVCIGSPLKFKEEGNPFLYLTFEEKGKRDVNYDFFKLLQSKENSFYFVDLGNPHLVCLINLEGEDPLTQRKLFDTFLSSKSVGEIINYLGQAMQREFLKTSGINVSFVVVESSTEVYVRTYERGVGETLSCGSGACASVFSIIKSHNVSRETLSSNQGNIKEVKVFNPGSEKTEEIANSFSIISLDEQDKIWLKGKGVKVGTIILNK